MNGIYQQAKSNLLSHLGPWCPMPALNQTHQCQQRLTKRSKNYGCECEKHKLTTPNYNENIVENTLSYDERIRFVFAGDALNLPQLIREILYSFKRIYECKNCEDHDL